MNRRKIILKLLVIICWFVVISGITTLLIAANSKQREHYCKSVLISINGGRGIYLKEKDILEQLEQHSGGKLTERSIISIDLGSIEKSLKLNSWISDVQLYFDNRDDLHINVKERNPIARIFNTDDYSFYIDCTGKRMPVLKNIVVRVPVVTGFSNVNKFNSGDSLVIQQIKKVTSYIYSDQFWNSQIGQVIIMPDRKFELVPVIGDHIIRIGHAEKIDEKLNRLYVFYKQLMSKVGFNKYSILDIEFEGQVVAVKRGIPSSIDSLQLKKNIEELMQRKNLQYGDQGLLPDYINSPDEQADPLIDSSIDSTETGDIKPDSETLKLKSQISQKKVAGRAFIVKPKEVRTSGRLPKAVMKKLK